MDTRNAKNIRKGSERADKTMSYFSEITNLGESLCKGTPFKFEYSLLNGWNKVSGAVNTDVLSDEKKMHLNLRDLFLKGNFVNFTKALVTVYHEYEHLKQYEACCYGYASAAVVVELIARQQNEDFYEDNYSSFTYEIQAERAGISKAYLYITEKYPELNAFECVKGYIDNQIKHGDTRYTGLGFENCKNIEDISLCFNRMYDKSLIKRNFQKIFYDYANDNYAQKSNGNLIYQMISDIGYDNTRNILSMLEDGYEQTRFVASYNITKIPEIKKTFKGKVIDRMKYEDYVKSYQQTGANRKEFLEKIGVISDFKEKGDNDD